MIDPTLMPIPVARRLALTCARRVARHAGRWALPAIRLAERSPRLNPLVRLVATAVATLTSSPVRRHAALAIEAALQPDAHQALLLAAMLERACVRHAGGPLGGILEAMLLLQQSREVTEGALHAPQFSN